MSLRDQLLAKGLVSKKQVAQAKRDLKKKRKQQQGSKKRKAEQRREAEARARAEREARARARLEARKAREEARDRYERALRIRNLILGHRIRTRGDYRFHFKAKDGRTILHMGVHRKIAEELARGNLAVAWLDQGNRDEYVLIGRKGAEKLSALGADEVLVHWFPGQPDRSELPYERDWPTSLRPHRVRAHTE